MLHPRVLQEQIARANENAHRLRCRLLCEIVDEFCPPPSVRLGPGRPITFTDNLVMKMELLGRLSGIRGETELLRHLERFYDWLFPQLPSQSWLWRRLARLAPKLEDLRQHLRYELGVALDDIRIVDTLPLPLFKTWRPGRGNGFDLADWGHCASKKLDYFGFKLMLSVTPDGIPDFYDLCSARPHDLNAIEELVSTLHGGLGLADKGFISQERLHRLAQTQDVRVLTYKRSNQKAQNAPLEQWLLDHYRQRIETTGSQLVDVLHIEDLGAKTDKGLAKRVIGAMAAFTLGIYLNFLLGRELLAVKSLFA
jgi:hypothetical protein